MTNQSLVVSPSVAAAKREGRPIVALESALITHGFAYPANVAVTRRMAEAIRQAGALPAVVGIWEGKPWIGLDDDQIDFLAQDTRVHKISVRDLPLTPLWRKYGGTTVAATATLAHLAGIQVFATGGIGGIHRGHPEDISADLPVLASTPIVVVCAGAKSILDLPRTLEYLETWGVPVVGWQTDEFPAFYSRGSGLRLDARADDPEAIARIFAQQRSLRLNQALLVTVPVPAEAEVPMEDIEPLISQALAEADTQGIKGKDVTPFILARLVALSEERTKKANVALLINNARIAAEIAIALAHHPVNHPPIS